MLAYLWFLGKYACYLQRFAAVASEDSLLG